MPIWPIAEFAPDLPDFVAGGSANILNVYPRTKYSYGPMPNPAPQYDALANRCQGASAYRDSAAATFIFAGDATDLYLLKAGLSSWQNASKAAAAYNAAGQVWRYTYFNGDAIATNGGDAPQYFTLASAGAFADLPGGPPAGKYVATVKNAFLVFADTTDPGNGNMPQRVWWSAAGNHKSWPLLGTTAAAQVQSGAVDLLGPSGRVQGIAADLLNADAIIFQQFGVRRMTYAGPPDIFTFLPVDNARGTLAPDSIVTYGGIAYYWGTDGVYAFDGGTSQPIGAGKVDKFLFGQSGAGGDVDSSNLARVVGTSDPYNKLIWWAYPSKAAAGGNPDKLLCYSWELNRFALSEVTCETLLRVLGIGYTLDQLYTVFGYTVDTVPAPMDSDTWTGGAPLLASFDAAHKLNFFTGIPLAATVETNEVQPFPGRRAFVRNARPLIDRTATGGFLPTVAIGHRESQTDAVAYGQASQLFSLGVCPVRSSGRYLRAKITVPVSSAWTNISGVEVELVPQGTR